MAWVTGSVTAQSLSSSPEVLNPNLVTQECLSEENPTSSQHVKLQRELPLGTHVVDVPINYTSDKQTSNDVSMIKSRGFTIPNLFKLGVLF